jgi:hypothetical protein
MPKCLVLTAIVVLAIAAVALDTEALVLFVILFVSACAMNASSEGFEEQPVRPRLNRRRPAGL